MLLYMHQIIFVAKSHNLYPEKPFQHNSTIIKAVGIEHYLKCIPEGDLQFESTADVALGKTNYTSPEHLF